jgi:hypothetical protein
MADTSKVRTHTAYGFKREGKKFGRLLEIGTGRLDKERGHVHVFLDRLPLQGFTGYVFLAPLGEKPPVPELRPQRPGQADDDEDDIEG